jgi:hypothetical protein
MEGRKVVVFIDALSVLMTIFSAIWVVFGFLSHFDTSKYFQLATTAFFFITTCGYSFVFIKSKMMSIKVNSYSFICALGCLCVFLISLERLFNL